MHLLTAKEWITRLNLKKHIEGGWYYEIYKSAEHLPIINNGAQSSRALVTHIYFLLQRDDFSTLHRIQSDELWHFYAGDPLEVYEILQDGSLVIHLLGNTQSAEEKPFCVINRGNWFGARVANGGNYSLVGCTVAPGFEFSDLELGNSAMLIQQFPQHASLIHSLCRK